MSTLSTKRFSSRVDAYLKYRPHYPDKVLSVLQKSTALSPADVIADVGSGTGFSAELFLANGNVVYGIEPNKEMREVGERYLAIHQNFRSVNATAEATTLPDHSVDYIIAGQAFHWFDFEKAYTEFKRILKPHGWLVIIWNDREADSTPFLIGYEKLLLEFGIDYNEINHRNIDSYKVREFYAGNKVLEFEFENQQLFDYIATEGRLLSSSYVPSKDDMNYQPMLNRLKELFDVNAKNGQIEMRYKTLLYAGQLSG